MMSLVEITDNESPDGFMALDHKKLPCIMIVANAVDMEQSISLASRKLLRIIRANNELDWLKNSKASSLRFVFTTSPLEDAISIIFWYFFVIFLNDLFCFSPFAV